MSTQHTRGAGRFGGHGREGRPRPTLATIVATLGPASDSPEIVAALVRAGVGVFRLNFSHGDLETHAKRIATVRGVALEIGQPVAILGDLQGPKIRVGTVGAAGETLVVGQDAVFTESPETVFDAAGTVALPSGWAGLAGAVKPGERVLINDGAVRLLAVERRGADGAGVLRCRVMVGGLVTSRKGINLPDSRIDGSAITEQDWRHVEFAVAQGLDFLALSFVRSAAEVLELKAALAGMCAADRGVDGASGGAGALIPVIAKIEKPQALKEIDAIVDAADGIMVARGDLGVELDLADVPVVQKRLIAKADDFGKPSIVATQMLESMITASSPAQAEKWPGVERMRTRERTIGMGMMAGERLDVVRQVENLKLEPAAAKELEPVLEQYAADLDRELKARNALYESAQGQAREILTSGDTAKMTKMIEDARSAAMRVRDVNRRYARQVEAMLPEEKRAAFSAVVKRESYPMVYREGRTARTIKGVQEFDDLTPEQKQAIATIVETHGRELAGLQSRMEQAQDQRETSIKADEVVATFMGGGGGGGRGMGRGMMGLLDSPELDELRTKRRELDSTTLDKVKAVLSPEQKARLETEDDDEPRGPRGRNRDGEGGEGRPARPGRAARPPSQES